MTPERKFELDGIAAFIEGVFKRDPDAVYLVLTKHPGEMVNVCTNIDPVQIPELLKAAADQAPLLVCDEGDAGHG